MNERHTTLTDRITYAETWLDQARRRLEGGEVTEGTLALVLAEAELHRAREAGSSGNAAPHAETRRPRAMWTTLGALTLAAGVFGLSLALFQPAPPGDAAGHAAPTIRLSDGTGEMLRIVTQPEPAVERTVVESRIVHVRVRVPTPAPIVGRPPAVQEVAVLSGPPVGVLPAVPPVKAVVPPAPAPQVVPVVVPAASLLTDAEVIDMVLAAERSLRRTGNQ